jgi:CyaY protein
MPGIMTESEFHRAVDAVLARVEASVENLEGLDVDLESVILTITCPDDSRVIVNRQTPNR